MATINIAQFTFQGVTRNVLETGEIELVINDIQRGRNERRVEMLLDCLSQALHLQGKYAGKCVGILTAELLSVSNLNRAAAESALNNPSYKHDSHLQDSILRVHALIMTALPINIYDIEGRDIVSTGKTDSVIALIMENNASSPDVKIKALFGCLLQVMSGKGRFAEKCTADLRRMIYQIAQSDSTNMRLFLQNDQIFKYEPKLTQIIQTAEHLAHKGPDIDLTHFSDGAHDEIDITKTGQIRLVIDYILQHVEHLRPPVIPAQPQVNANQAKIEAHLHCLSQARVLSGPFQGCIESELKNSIFQLARANPAAARAALANSRFTNDEKLNAVCKLLYLLTEDFQHIDMRNFLTAEGWIDVLDTGRIDLVVQFIHAQAGNNLPEEEIKSFLNCLSQTLSLGGRKQGICESSLKHDIYELSKRNPSQAYRITQMREYTQVNSRSGSWRSNRPKFISDSTSEALA